MSRRGLSLVEILVSLLIAGIVSAGTVRLLLQQRLAFSSQLYRSERLETLRVANAFFQMELGPLDARDGDLLVRDEQRLVYRGSRAVGFVCAAPGPGGDIVIRTPLIGWRAIDPSVDSALIFAEGDVLARDDDRWIHADVTGTDTSHCEDGSTGRRITLGLPTGETLGAVRFGAPVRIGSIHEVRLYRGGDGAWWLGERRFRKGAGWPAIQPMLGPLELNGLAFRYLDAGGGPAATPADVVLVEISIRSSSNIPGHSPVPATIIRVALRG